MRKFAILSIVLILTLALSACAYYENGKFYNPDVNRKKAVEIAVNKAGVARSDIRDLDVEFDVERGIAVWEIDFEHGALEYSFDVDAETGSITKVERERDN
ncbi:MAG: PepSY domain-containing protein [Clostridia bacterium]|nr:PepSY domain-containing protein [Clostridia bacterium]